MSLENQKPSKVYQRKEKQALRFSKEQDPEGFCFDTYEQASAKSKEINKEYQNLSFVAKDRGGFVVLFKTLHQNHGLEEYIPEEDEKLKGAA